MSQCKPRREVLFEYAAESEYPHHEVGVLSKHVGARLKPQLVQVTALLLIEQV